MNAGILRSTPPPESSGAGAERPGSPDVVVRRAWGGRAHPDAVWARPFSIVVCTYRRPESVGRLLDSLAAQDRPEKLVVVDASPDALTEEVVTTRRDLAMLAGEVLYLRVTGSLRGLTRQRALGLAEVRSERVVFCDDDVTLRPDCLGTLTRTLEDDPGVVAAVPFVENEISPPPLRWRVFRLLGVVPRLTPGRYYGSGVSVPWRFQPETDRVIPGDWVYGCVMAWRTEAVRAVGFSLDFEGYSNGEDVDLSLRARGLGKRVLVGAARVIHHHENAGRPDPYELGYMSLRNAWSIHRRCLDDRRWYHDLWFAYATVVAAAIRCVDVFRPSRSRQARRFLRGQLRFLRLSLTGGNR